MSFLSPLYLWALVLLAPLVAAYLLKVRPTRRPVTAMFLWQQIYSEKKASRMLHRLRDLLSLLLLALALLGLVLALAQPRFSDAGQEDVLVIIDTSASMSARVDGQQRLDLARARAKQIIRSLHGRQRAAVATASQQLQFRAQLTDDVRQLLTAVDEVQPTALPLRWQAVEELLSETQLTQGLRVVLLTDRDHAQRSQVDRLDVVALRPAASNVGIIACDLAAAPGHPGQMALFYQLASSFETALELDMLLEQDGRLRRVIPVTVEPGVNEAQHLLVQGDPGRWTARLSISDALAMDDAAYLVAAEPQPIPVGVHATEPYFLQHTVLAFQQGGDLLSLESAEDAKVVIAQGSWPGDASQAIVFHPLGASPAWGELHEEIETPLPRQVVEDHPALRFLDVESMAFDGARRTATPDGALALVEDVTGAPLMWEMVAEGTRAVVVNADPARGSTVFSASFPILIHGLVTHLAGRSEQPQSTWRSGQTVSLPASQDATVAVRTPSGEAMTVANSQLPVDQVGFYEVSPGEDATAVGVSLLSPEDSTSGHGEEVAEASSLAGGYPPEYLLILLGAVLLVGESILYHRRKVG